MLRLLQIGQFLAWDQQTNGTALPRNPLDETIRFQRQHHLVHGWWRNVEILFHVGLRGSHSVYLRVVEDERQVLSLLRGIALVRHCRPIVRDCLRKSPAPPQSARDIVRTGVPAIVAATELDGVKCSRIGGDPCVFDRALPLCPDIHPARNPRLLTGSVTPAPNCLRTPTRTDRPVPESTKQGKRSPFSRTPVKPRIKTGRRRR